MSLLAIVLVVISAFMHAGWNLLSKSKNSSPSFFLIASITGCVVLSPTLYINRDIYSPELLRELAPILFGTGIFMALYYACLAKCYQTGDISVAYPIARSSPVIVVAIVSLLLGRSDQLTTQCFIGIFLVVGGCFLIPLKHFRDFKLSNYLNITCIMALLAAVGTSGYSILDDEGLRILRENSNLDSTQSALLYGCLEAISASVWLAMFVALSRKERENFKTVFSEQKKHAILAGVAIFSTYTLVLISMAHVKNVSYVVGFRQLSIPLGTALGIFVLKESANRPKLVGAGIIFAGLILVATG